MPIVSNSLATSQHKPFKAATRMALVSLLFLTPFYAAYGASDQTPDSADASPDDTTELVTEKLCDGSDQIRLYFRLDSEGSIGDFDWTYYENGFDYFMVDGNCRYWAFSSGDAGGPYGKWNDAWSGELSEQDAATLSAEVRWGSLEDLSGYFRETDVNHGSIWRISNGRAGMLTCVMECPDEENQRVITAAREWLTRMIDHGEPIDDTFRGFLILMPEEAEENHLATELPEELVPFVVDYTDLTREYLKPGETMEFPPEVRDLLKDLRQEYRSREPGFKKGFIPLVNADGRTLQLHIRPSIEPEGENGLVDFEFASPQD